MLKKVVLAAAASLVLGGATAAMVSAPAMAGKRLPQGCQGRLSARPQSAPRLQEGVQGALQGLEEGPQEAPSPIRITVLQR